MSLQVIGAGFGRTGTNSLKLALEKLGFGKCHHMTEVLANPEQAEGFLAAARGEAIDWELLYEGYHSCCDWPSCFFWRELSEIYPTAKVILSRRPSALWYDSMSETILPSMAETLNAFENPTIEMGREILFRQTFAENIVDREHVVDVYERHNRQVIEIIPADRLLVFDPVEGWEPLCGFLGVPIPDEPYPATNAKEEFMQTVASMKEQMSS